jgi:hypothetical protein
VLVHLNDLHTQMSKQFSSRYYARIYPYELSLLIMTPSTAVPLGSL